MATEENLLFLFLLFLFKQSSPVSGSTLRVSALNYLVCRELPGILSLVT